MQVSNGKISSKLIMTWKLGIFSMRMKLYILCELAMKMKKKMMKVGNLFQLLETCNAINALKQGLLGRGFADHDNLLAKLEKASSQVLTAETNNKIAFFTEEIIQYFNK